MTEKPHPINKQINAAFLRSELLSQVVGKEGSNGSVVVGKNHNRIAQIQVEIKMGADAPSSTAVPNNPMPIDHPVFPPVGIRDARFIWPLYSPSEKKSGRR